jgi:hypothetical protein
MNAMLRMLTAGESHGKALVAIVEGLPAGVGIDPKEIAGELARRRHGYGRGGRQRFEADRFEILTGVRHGKSLGSPIAITIPNVEFEAKYADLMAVEGAEDPDARLTRPRPIQSNERRSVTVPQRGHRVEKAAGQHAHAPLDRVDAHAGYHLVPLNSPPAVTGKINNASSFDRDLLQVFAVK